MLSVRRSGEPVVPTARAAAPGVIAPRSASAGSLPEKVVSAEPWDFGSTPGRLYRTAWYRLFATETDPAILATLPAFLEAALDHYTTAIGPLPRPTVKLDTYLMATRGQWSVMARQVMGPQVETYLRIPRGGFAAGGRALLWSIGPRDTLAIAAHEGWHQYTQRAFKQPLPVWLEEGIATYMEGFVDDPDEYGRVDFLPWANAERFDQLRAAASASAGAGRLLPLDELLSATPQQLLDAGGEGTLTYYAQVWALVHFLNEGQRGVYGDALRALLADAAEGRLGAALHDKLDSSTPTGMLAAQSGPSAFLAYFHADLGTAAAEYRAFVDHLVRAGTREQIMAGRPPIFDRR